MTTTENQETKVIRIIDVTITTGGTSTNLLDVEERLIQPGELKTPPNLYNPVGIKQDENYWLLTLTHDGFTDIYDTFFEDDAANPVIASLIITFTVVQNDVEYTETWTYKANQKYVYNGPEGDVEAGRQEQDQKYYILAYGDKAVALTS